MTGPKLFACVSVFANCAAGSQLKVGHELESSTIEIQAVSMKLGANDVVLIDTPGFDDTSRSQAEILQLIAEFLRRTYSEDKLLTGIIYLHDISSNRIAQSDLGSYRLFRKLCGDAAMTNVVIATTMWDDVDQQLGANRLQELQDDFFKDAYDRGVPIMRHDNTRQSAHRILSRLLGKDGTRCDIQYEMVDEGKSVENTAAGKELLHQFDEFEDTHGKQLRAAQDSLEPIPSRNGLRDGSGGTEEGADVRELRIALEQVRQELRRVQDERDKLRQTLGQDLTAHIKRLMLCICPI
ncbi:uncharacterized protein B0H18DRAFT_1170661 [Fomitopsis serialis]|uniref:uncharacterized protein n=1 Tax=Fomitopsis serialis TaxID=139415 RepID=UPI0020081BAE|nr:uncharacterized protein B0H18DRAFT_1170661 [Neoantrodia serialis]KAH9925218.1 hypothetical protein B0H18DRAFT_1170661 [Neoantrodia serialis]